MSDAPDFSALASRYLDLWQEALRSAASDPVTAQALAKLYQAFGAAGWPGAFAAAAPPAGARHDGSGATSRAASPGGASGDGAGDHDRLADRLAGIERRLAALERRPKPAKRAKRPQRAAPGNRGRKRR
ncbi:MAG TPA: hypothetical protein VIM38_06060 [Alphaproteobacteria bacterium]